MENTFVTLSVDLKKYCIRLHKATYRLIGQPKYIQLLVNPKERVVAVRAISKPSLLQVYHFLFQKCGTEKVPVFDTKKADTNIHKHINMPV